MKSEQNIDPKTFFLNVG